MNSLLQATRSAYRRCGPATRLSLVAALMALANPWFGLVIGLAAAWQHTRKTPLNFEHQLALWYFIPVLVALIVVARGVALPSDDLLRHLVAWRTGLDYRAQYPWSDIPKANLWLGFDFMLGALQRAGVSKELLVKLVPSVSLALQSIVLYAVLNRAIPPRHRNAQLFLLVGAVGLLILSPRALLGRPEMFLLTFGVCASLCRSRGTVALWCAGYLALTPCYWLGWIYAPLALLIAPRVLSLAARVALVAVLGGLHLAFWQSYTGDYLGLLLWLKGTLSVPAAENIQMLFTLSVWSPWVLLAGLSFTVSCLNLRRARRAAPVLLLLCWFAMANQLRYLAAVGFVTLPWAYRTLALVARANRVTVPSTVVVLGIALAAVLAVFSTNPTPTFALPASARVYSDSPYATVFYGQPGISVEPSFALGATRPEWRTLKQHGTMRCDLLLRGRFTHVIEQNLDKPLECATLAAVQGPWRLWRITRG